MSDLKQTNNVTESKTIAMEEKTTLNSNHMDQIFSTLLTACMDFFYVAELQKTERRKIEAWEKVTVEKINVMDKAIQKYLEGAFCERDTVFKELFKRLDEAEDLDDSNIQFAAILTAIIQVAQSNPLKKLDDLDYVKAALSDTTHQWKL